MTGCTSNEAPEPTRDCGRKFVLPELRCLLPRHAEDHRHPRSAQLIAQDDLGATLGCQGTLVDMPRYGIRPPIWRSRARPCPLGIGTGPAYTIATPTTVNGICGSRQGASGSTTASPPHTSKQPKAYPGAGQPLGADIALIRRHHDAVVIECKHSDDPAYIGRDGYHQALTYLTEIRTRVTPNAIAVVIGPEGVVTEPAGTVTAVGRVSIVPPRACRIFYHSERRKSSPP